LGTFEYVSLRSAGYLEQRSGFSVHRGRFSGGAQTARHLDQNGRPGPRARQRFRFIELIYPGDFADGWQLFAAPERYFHIYNQKRPHEAI
jgi:hypothetical protein